jgi:hypothetical protein
MAEATTCPHCGGTFSVPTIKQHLRACPDAPTVHAAIAEALADPDKPGFALSAHRYNNRRVFLGAPGHTTVLPRYGNTWAGVCEAFGLLPPEDDYSERIANLHRPQTCPHCRRSFAASVLRRHADVCPENPALRDAIIAAMQNVAYPGFAVSLAEYQEHAAGAPITGVKTLKQHFGSWRNTVAYYGLRMTTDSELMELRELAEMRAQMAAERALLAEDAARAYMLPVARVLPAPGLRVNGRECVRCVLR